MAYFESALETAITGRVEILFVGSNFPERVHIDSVLYKTDGEPLALYDNTGAVYVWNTIVKITRR